MVFEKKDEVNAKRRQDTGICGNSYVTSMSRHERNQNFISNRSLRKVIWWESAGTVGTCGIANLAGYDI